MAKFKAYSVADLPFFDYDKILQIYIITIAAQAYIIATGFGTLHHKHG
ncbi:hypothetical protein [Psychrobacter sp. H7-1]|jgi:hypothetical protein|nr:hypothetical protein [Psychrobacter sp. H7-1]